MACRRGVDLVKERDLIRPQKLINACWNFNTLDRRNEGNVGGLETKCVRVVDRFKLQAAEIDNCGVDALGVFRGRELFNTLIMSCDDSIRPRDFGRRQAGLKSTRESGRH